MLASGRQLVLSKMPAFFTADFLDTIGSMEAGESRRIRKEAIPCGDCSGVI